MKKLIIPALVATLGIFCGCSALDKDPQSTLSPENYFKTQTDLQLFSNSFYDSLLDKTPYKHQSDYQTQNTLSNELIGGGQRSIPASGGGWSWSVLRKINTMLGHIDNCNDPSAVKQYTGVAKFFRAYFYAQKVIRFGDVPWIDRELGSDDEALYYPRDPREMVVDNLLTDLDEAIEYLPEEVSTYRVNKWSALALKAQFCLFEGTWRKYHANDDFAVEGKAADYFLGLARDAAKQIMESGKYSLAPDYLMLFAQVDADPNEYILAIKNDFSLAIFQGCTSYALMSTQGAPGLTRKFVNTYLMKDGSRFTDKQGWETMGFVEECADRDPRLGMTVRTPGYMRIGGTEELTPDFTCTNTGYQMAKFVMDCTLEGVDRVYRSFNDMPVFRYGEILLIYAEARAELGELTQDDLDQSINKLRQRVGMPNMDLASLTVDPYLTSAEFGYTNPILLGRDNLAAILEIRREREVELAFEGKRWNDLMRWAEGGAIEQPIYGMYFAKPDGGKDGEYDLTGNGKADLLLYSGDKAPSRNDVVCLHLNDLNGMMLTGGNYGYVLKHQVSSGSGYVELERVFNPKRDYLYPLPSDDLVLNPKLQQNPGW